MYRRLTLLVVVSSLGSAQSIPAPDKLPIRRVVLYKNGVGYFEHSARVHGCYFWVDDLNCDPTNVWLSG